MKCQLLKTFCVLLFCSLMAQAQPIVDDRVDLDGNLEKGFEEEGVKNPLDHFGTSQNNLEAGLEEGQLEFISDLDTDNNIEDCMNKDVKNSLEHFVTACISFKVVGKKEDLNFLSGWDPENINQTFWFSDCGGKQNILEKTLDDCEKKCSSVIDPFHFGCSLPMDEGSCVTRDSPPILRWFHNPRNGNCEPFWFSGCCGNQNNFQTLDDCEKTCSEAIGINTPDSLIR